MSSVADITQAELRFVYLKVLSQTGHYTRRSSAHTLQAYLGQSRTKQRQCLLEQRRSPADPQRQAQAILEWRQRWAAKVAAIPRWDQGSRRQGKGALPQPIVVPSGVWRDQKKQTTKTKESHMFIVGMGSTQTNPAQICTSLRD